MANEDLAKVDTYLQYLNLYRRSYFPLQNQCFFFEKTIFSQFDFLCMDGWEVMVGGG